MKNKKVSIWKVLIFSKKSHVNIFSMFYYVLSPHPKIRLTDALKISTSLGMSIDNYFDIHFDIQRAA